MSNTFNLTRFLRYFKKHSIDNGKTYLLSTAVLTGIYVIALFFVVALGTGFLNIDWQMTVLLTCVLLGGGIFTSLTFADLGDKKKAIPVLTLPVSALEKYLVNWIYTYVIFLLVAVGTFYMVDILAVKISKPSYGHIPARLLDLTSKETPGIIVLTAFTLFHALGFWGAIFFEKMHFIKTAFVFFVCLIGFNLLTRVLISAITSGNVTAEVFFQHASVTDNGNQHYISPTNPINQIGIAIFIVAVLILWVSAYFRLKEKQV